MGEHEGQEGRKRKNQVGVTILGCSGAVGMWHWGTRAVGVGGGVGRGVSEDFSNPNGSVSMIL